MLIGDYLLQSDWMASQKTKGVLPALAHAVFYTLPFLFLTQTFAALAVIAVSHFLIDHYRLARYVVWAKNFLAPRWLALGARNGDVEVMSRNYPWVECQPTGYHKSRPEWLTFWLFFIADNTLHLVINGLAVQHLG